MPSSTSRRTARHWLVSAVALSCTLAAAGCGGDDAASDTAAPAASAAAGGASAAAGGGDGEKIGVSLITKTSTNPFFVAMQEGAQKDADSLNVDLTLAAGKADGDEDTQIQAIENAISQGQKGILITPNGPGVNGAIEKARAEGLFVIALDTPPDPAETVDITFATDNFKAGELIGKWAATKLDGKPATIAMLDLFDDKIVSVDYNRDQGFLTGMGIDTADAKKNGDEAKTGKYSGGEYELVCNAATQGAEDGGRTAMENCLSQNDAINVVYTINEPAAVGAYEALKAAGKEKGVIIVSVDGGCPGVESVKSKVIGATSQQYPLEMASLGVKAIVDFAKDGTKPAVTSGLDFYDTGVKLVTDEPADGVESIDTAAGAAACWG